MVEPSLELIMEALRRMQADLASIRETQREHTQRLGRIEHATAQWAVTYAEQSIRIDRLFERVERIERRLEISE